MSAHSRDSNRRNTPTGKLLVRAASRAFVLSLLWLALSRGDFGTWYLGAAAVVLATAISLFFVPPGPQWRWTLAGTARFVPFFLWQSLSGGTDVALRALRPDMPLEPDLVEYESSLSNPTALAFMVAVVSLLPGTLGTEVDGKKIYIHSLVGEERAKEGASNLEERISDLFGLSAEVRS